MTVEQAVRTLAADLAAAPVQNVPTLRAVRRRYSRAWRSSQADFILDVARALVTDRRYRWVGYELIRFHPGAFSSLTDRLLVELAAGLDSWDGVDSFGRILSGPAWAGGLASDRLIAGWARASDRWLRRAALVSTIELRETSKILAICDTLAPDRDDMVEKALSWALRELGKRDPDAVRRFLDRHDAMVGARVKREVGNKLRTGLKNPGQPRQPIRNDRAR